MPNLIDAFRGFQAAFPSARLLVITRFSHAILQQEFDRIPALAGRFTLVSSDSPQSTVGLLRAGDYAVLPFSDGVSEVEELIGYTMIASKTGEYLATGLPMLVNQKVGAAAQLVETHNLGCVYRSGEEMQMADDLRRMDEQHGALRLRCRAVAVDYFSAALHARRYLDIYASLTGPIARAENDAAAGASMTGGNQQP